MRPTRTHTLDRSDPYYLSRIMDFDHVIRVHPDGTVTDAPESWAPEVIDEDGTLSQHPNHSGWSLMNGYSGQQGYSGPVMHPSEFIGGGLARDILATPGEYVSLVVETDDEDDDEPAGWAVAYREATQDGTK